MTCGRVNPCTLDNGLRSTRRTPGRPASSSCMCCDPWRGRQSDAATGSPRRTWLVQEVILRILTTPASGGKPAAPRTALGAWGRGFLKHVAASWRRWETRAAAGAEELRVGGLMSRDLVRVPGSGLDRRHGLADCDRAALTKRQAEAWDLMLCGENRIGISRRLGISWSAADGLLRRAAGRSRRSLAIRGRGAARSAWAGEALSRAQETTLALYARGLSYARIANLTHESREAVRSRIRRLRRAHTTPDPGDPTTMRLLRMPSPRPPP